jgi:selenoprotein W-related protein
MVLVPSDGGRFEILLDGKPIYSKLETGQFPETRDIIKAISARMGS